MSRQRTWAAEAHAEVMKVARTSDQGKIRTLCMKTPSLIHQSGLAQAIVFLRSREKGIGKDFVDMLARVLGTTREGVNSGEKLQKMALGEGDLSAYMALTQDVSDVAAWLRRFAQIELKEDENGEQS